MAFLLVLQWSLVAAGLCAVWRRRARHAGAAWAALLAPALMVAAMLLLLRFDQALAPDERALMGLLALFSGGLWLFGFLWSPEPVPARRVLRSPSATGAWWITLSLLLLGAFVLTSTWVVLNDFLSMNPHMAPAWRWLWLTLIAALASGALLTGVALAGLLQAVPTDAALARRASADRIPDLVNVMILAVALRMLAVACSLMVWAWHCPFGARHFISRLLTDSSWNLVTLRALLGFVLPLLFGVLALSAWQGGARRQAAAQFLPVLVLAIISEMIAAGLTVGMGGLAF